MDASPTRRRQLDAMADITRFQRNLITRAQAHGVGVTDEDLATYLGDGELGAFTMVNEAVSEVARADDTFVWRRAAPSEHLDLWAAFLKTRPSLSMTERMHAGPYPDLVVSHWSVAAVHRIGVFARPPPTFTVLDAQIDVHRPDGVRVVAPHRPMAKHDVQALHWGMYMTTHARMIADLLADREETSHVGVAAMDIAYRVRESTLREQRLNEQLEPFAAEFGVADGAAVWSLLREIGGRSFQPGR